MKAYRHAPELTDDVIEKSFEGTNFGRTDYREFLGYSVLKKACGWHCGHTITTIMIEMGLITPKHRHHLTKLGRMFLSDCYDDPLRAKDSAPPAASGSDDYFSSLVSKARQSAEKAMIKFPQPNYVLLKVAEEAGEVVQAGVHYAEGRETWENLEGEVIQTIAMLFRLVTEGDQVNGVIPPAAPGGDDVKQG